MSCPFVEIVVFMQSKITSYTAKVNTKSNELPAAMNALGSRDHELVIVETNLALDPELIERALEVSGEKTTKAAVTRALEEFIARRSQRRLVGLMGKLEWDATFDYKSERSRR